MADWTQPRQKRRRGTWTPRTARTECRTEAEVHVPSPTTPKHDAIARQLDGYRLTTAEILYRLPDHPGLLQTFVWQDLDMAPAYPVLNRFLDFWTRSLDGKLHSVRVASVGLVSPGHWRHAALVAQIH
jgi:uncharacterized protein Usg